MSQSAFAMVVTITLIVLLAYLVVTFPIASDKQAASNEMTAQGKRLYVQQCSSCHDRGTAPSGAPDLPSVLRQRSSQALERTLLDAGAMRALHAGVTGDAPRTELSREQAEALVDYLEAAQ